MEIELEPGSYIVAVSGGVDSVVLLHALHTTFHLPSSTFQFIVAHFDHGIRPDSARDRQFVERLAKEYGLEFHYGEGQLGPDASEAAARAARYQFLRAVKNKVSARAIITAHHQDDRLETAIINMLRGTGRLGPTALKSRGDIVRPLLKYTKADLTAYAKQQGLSWREDATNTDDKYLRNRVRRDVLPFLTLSKRRQLLAALDRLEQVNQELDLEIANLLQIIGEEKSLRRRDFINLPHQVAVEVMAAWLRQHALAFDRKLLVRLVRDAKVLSPGKTVDISGTARLVIDSDVLRLETKVAKT